MFRLFGIDYILNHDEVDELLKFQTILNVVTEIPIDNSWQHEFANRGNCIKYGREEIFPNSLLTIRYF